MINATTYDTNVDIDFELSLEFKGYTFKQSGFASGDLKYDIYIEHRKWGIKSIDIGFEEFTSSIAMESTCATHEIIVEIQVSREKCICKVVDTTFRNLDQLTKEFEVESMTNEYEKEDYICVNPKNLVISKFSIKDEKVALEIQW